MKQVEKMMKRIGVQAVQISADEVIIKTPEKDIIIKQPQVTKINTMGQDIFQIMGNITERNKERFTDEDIKLIMEQTGANKEKAKEMLKKTGDIAEAILKLKG